MNTRTYVKMEVQTPFTSLFPRYNRWHAVQSLKQIGNDFLVLDCESSGIGKQAELTELAIVRFSDCKVLFNSLIRPRELDDKYEESKARQVSGISIDELRTSPTLPQVWDEVLSILQSKHITSFNTQFDIPLIRNSAHKWDLEVPVLYGTCLMKIVTAFLNLDFWLSLDEASSWFCVDNVVSHRALADALTTVEVVRRMKEGSNNGKI